MNENEELAEIIVTKIIQSIGVSGLVEIQKLIDSGDFESSFVVRDLFGVGKNNVFLYKLIVNKANKPETTSLVRSIITKINSCIYSMGNSLSIIDYDLISNPYKIMGMLGAMVAKSNDVDFVSDLYPNLYQGMIDEFMKQPNLSGLTEKEKNYMKEVAGVDIP